MEEVSRPVECEKFIKTPLDMANCLAEYVILKKGKESDERKTGKD